MKHKVLIVDDNPKNLQVIAATLSENNYQVEVALSGKAALVWLENTSFDIILLDIMMPEMDGYETCKAILSNPKNKNIPIIFLTRITSYNVCYTKLLRNIIRVIPGRPADVSPPAKCIHASQGSRSFCLA